MMILASTKPEGFLNQMWWIFEENWPLFWYGVKVTILLAIVGTLAGFVIGLILGGIRSIKVEKQDSVAVKFFKRILHLFVKFYVWIFRGTPMMVQAFVIYYGLRDIMNWTPLVAGMFIISINTGSYMAEIVRSGIQSIDKGQYEAARSIGMTSTQTLFHIILPQAVRNSFPSIGNQLIVNIKDSSMLNVISVTDLYFQTSSVAGGVYLFAQTFMVSAIIYLILTTLASKLLAIIEQKLDTTKKGSASTLDFV